jgi:prepilin-type N-terminal cleavage/methylation domain-containing protein
VKTLPTSRLCSKAARAFTLIESIFAMAILSVGSVILYNTFRTSLVLTAKNISLNQGNTGLQWSYYRLLSTLESAAFFVDCANYDPSTQTFTGVSSGTWGNSVRFMRLLPITCYVKPDDNSGYTVSNPPPSTRSVYLNSSDQFVFVTYNASLYNPSVIPSSARFYPTFPSVSQTVTGGTSPGVKPGLAFDVIDYTSTPGLIGMHFPAALGSNTFQDCNRAYFIVESAFAVTTSAVDGHKELLYFPDTSQTGSPITISQKLDGANQTKANDPTIPTGGTSGTFCMVSGVNAVQTLLPIRSLEYFNVMGRNGGSAARNNTWINVNSKFYLRQNL